MEVIAILVQLKHCEKDPPTKCSLNVNYPALAHSNRSSLMKKNIKEVLTNLRIYLTPNDMFHVKLNDIFNPFTKINTNSYSKLLKYVRSDTPAAISQWELQHNFAVWCATSGCGVAMTHLLSNIFTNDPQFSSLSQKKKMNTTISLIYLILWFACLGFMSIIKQEGS